MQKLLQCCLRPKHRRLSWNFFLFPPTNKVARFLLSKRRFISSLGLFLQCAFWWCLVLPCASESNLRFSIRFFFNKLSRAAGAVVVLQSLFFFFGCLIAINWWWCPLKVRAKRNNLGFITWWPPSRDDAKEELWISLLTWSLEIMICALGENNHEK